jgi:predicted nuclease of predicted toxin-antitoxin system
MKGFLFDANVPSRLQFKPSLPLISLSAVGPNPTDTNIWNYAASHQLVIVSKDTDFSDRIIIRTSPPWVVHIRFGNMRKREFHRALARLWPQVEILIKTHKLVNVYADRVEGIH